MEIAIIWAGVVVFLALLIKHHYVAKQAGIEERYDNELSGLTLAIQGLNESRNKLLDIVSDRDREVEALHERVTKLERQFNDAQVAKSLGRR